MRAKVKSAFVVLAAAGVTTLGGCYNYGNKPFGLPPDLVTPVPVPAAEVLGPYSAAASAPVTRKVERIMPGTPGQ